MRLAIQAHAGAAEPERQAWGGLSEYERNDRRLGGRGLPSHRPRGDGPRRVGGSGHDEVEAIELLMLTAGGGDAGQFLLTPELVQPLVAGEIEISDFYVQNVRF